MYIHIPVIRFARIEDLLHGTRHRHLPRDGSGSGWNRFGPMFASEIRKTRVKPVIFDGGTLLGTWNEVFVRINGETHYLCFG